MPTWATPAALKFWVGLAGAILIAVATALGDKAPPYLAVLVAVATAVGVYLAPNRDTDAYQAPDPYLPDEDDEDVV